jgi:hypothetical protein
LTDRLSRTQIDKLGERLKGDQPSESDLQLLDEYRRSFSQPYDAVVRAIREQLGLAPTGRPSKTNPSLREKLRRESIRLTQVQDIAGCRLVVPDPDIKYGGGDPNMRALLLEISDGILDLDSLKERHRLLVAQLTDGSASAQAASDIQHSLEVHLASLLIVKQMLAVAERLSRAVDRRTT